MGANIQWLKEQDGEIGIFRCGEAFSEFLDPWGMASVIQRTEDGGAHMLVGYSNMKPMELFKYKEDIEKLMKEQNISYIIWEKLRPDGTVKQVRIKIPKE